MAELNGRPVDPDSLLTLALTHYAHFTSMRVDDRRIRGLSRHMERLIRDCRFLFGAELHPDRVRHCVRHAVRELTGSFVVRVTVFDPTVDMGHPASEVPPLSWTA
ncbi:aminotransferase class IV [Streptomyces pimonensis]|uniref:Aminotransferase class IV n=1 Tax=Streptomyces pimonensis TaxID=2860288 RepID=A0ABV4J7D1_9ACTN